MKNQKGFLTSIIIISFFSVVFLIIVNLNIIDISINEINTTLERIEQVGDSEKSLHMLLKYYLISKKLNSQDENEKSFLEEASLELTLPEINFEDLKQNDKYEYNVTYKIAMFCINHIRKLIGKKKYFEIGSYGNSTLLERAYVLERSKRYSEATKLFMDFINTNQELSINTWGAVKLHIAFCKAQQGNIDEALKTLKLIIKKAVNTESQTVAKQLFDILHLIDNSKKSILVNNSMLDKAKNLFFLTYYKKAINNFKHFIYLTKKKSEKIEAKYYLARCYEEIGKIQKACNLYKKIIKKSKNNFKDKAIKRLLYIQQLYAIYDKEKKHISNILKNYKIKDSNKLFLNKLKTIVELTRTNSNNDNSKNKNTQFNLTNVIKSATIDINNIEQNIKKAKKKSENKAHYALSQKTIENKNTFTNKKNNIKPKKIKNIKKRKPKVKIKKPKQKQLKKTNIPPTDNFSMNYKNPFRYMSIEKKSKTFENHKSKTSEKPIYNVNMKDGSIIKGSMKDWIEPDKILIETKNGKFLIKKDQVKSIKEYELK